MPSIDPQESNITYSSFQLRPNAQVRVTTAPWKDKVKVHIREWYRHNEDEEYIVGRGMTVPPEALEEIIQGLILAEQTLKEGNITV